MRIRYKSYGDMCRDVAKNFEKFNGDWDLVVGIPRSGMIPAYIIALALNVNCTDIASWVNNRPLKRGGTRKVRKDIGFPWEAKKVLVVDDSIMSGESMKNALVEIPSWLSLRAHTLAVYSNKPIRNDVDIILEFVPCPRVFEWNVFHHSVISRSCISLESMAYEDRASEGGIINRFRYTTSGQINTIVSCRRESSRNEVEALLNDVGISYRSLVMASEDDDLITVESLVRLKVDAFKSSSADMFIEGDSGQSRYICREVAKPVFCLNDNLMYNPGSSLGARRMKDLLKQLLWKFSSVNARLR